MKRTKTLIASGIALTALAGLAGFGLQTNTIPANALGVSSMTALESSALESSRATTTYTADAVHSNVLFKIRHGSVANFYGRFNEIKGTIEFDESDVTNSSMEFVIPAASVDTNNSSRDDHIRDAEFFNARQFKNISFESTSITEKTDGVYTLTGNLTLHGVTREIDATLAEVRTGSFRGKPVIGFEARFSIQRSDYDIMKYLAEDLSDNGPLGNTVEIIVAIEAGIK
ncbi:MAG: YceI family protein [Phycisphaerales bacterium]|nr:YceI family protein [Phycisphaerales bacterium]